MGGISPCTREPLTRPPTWKDMEFEREDEDEDVELGGGIAMNPVHSAARGSSRLLGFGQGQTQARSPGRGAGSGGGVGYLSVSTRDRDAEDAVLEDLNDPTPGGSSVQTTNPLVSVITDEELAFNSSYRSNSV